MVGEMAAEEVSGNYDYAATERARAHPLDIVRDCAELAGTFPLRVQFDSILFRHGNPRQMTSEQLYANACRLAPHCAQADYIGIEIGSAQDPDHLLDDFDTLNAAIQSGKTTQIILHNPILAHVVLGIVSGLDALERDTMPVFFPFDSWNNSEITSSMVRLIQAMRRGEPGIVKLEAHAFRQREALAIKQLHAFAHEVDDGTPKRVAVLQGTMHYLTAVGLRALGAAVTRTHVDTPVLSPIALMTHMVRMHQPEDVRQDQVELYEYASELANYIFGAACEIHFSPSSTDPEHDESDLHARLGILCLKGASQLLPPHIQAVFDRFTQALDDGAPDPEADALMREFLSITSSMLGTI